MSSPTKTDDIEHNPFTEHFHPEVDATTTETSSVQENDDSQKDSRGVEEGNSTEENASKKDQSTSFETTEHVQETTTSTSENGPSTSGNAPPSSRSSSSSKNSILPERNFIDKYKLLVKVIGIERVGTLSNKRENPTIVFNCGTNIPSFRKKQYKNIKKTVNEFATLQKYLNKSIQETFIPTLPITSTNFGINNQEDYDQIINCFQEWFNRICQDPLIIRCEEIVYFIESDLGTYTPINKITYEVISGLRRKTLKQLAPPYDENITLAEFRPLVKSIYRLSKETQDKLIKVNKTRRLLSVEENIIGNKYISMSESSDNKLHKMYFKLGKITIAISDIDSIVSTMEMATFYDGLEWIIRDAYNIKESLTNRHFIMRELISAQNNCKNKQEIARKLRNKRDANPLKIEEAIDNLKEVTKLEQSLTLRLQRTTENMLIERNRWLNWYTNWLQKSIKSYVIKKIEFERKKLALLEKIRIDVRNADHNGGLSRLGRSHITRTGSDTGNAHVSQTLVGDSWTGENRKRDERKIQEIFDENEFGGADMNRGVSNNTTAGSSHLTARNAVSMFGLMN